MRCLSIINLLWHDLVPAVRPAKEPEDIPQTSKHMSLSRAEPVTSFNSSWLSYSFVPIWDLGLSFLCSLLVVLQECHRHLVNFQLVLEGSGTTRSSVSHRWDTLSRSLSRGENSQDSHPWQHHSSVILFLWPRAITHKAEGQSNGVSRFFIPFSLQGRSQSAPRLLQHCFDEG